MFANFFFQYAINHRFHTSDQILHAELIHYYAYLTHGVMARCPNNIRYTEFICLQACKFISTVCSVILYWLPRLSKQQEHIAADGQNPLTSKIPTFQETKIKQTKKLHFG